jgi:hypothetical protein
MTPEAKALAFASTFLDCSGEDVSSLQEQLRTPTVLMDVGIAEKALQRDGILPPLPGNLS